MSIWDGIDSLFGREDPTKQANHYLNQIPDVGRDAYNPFIDQGKRAGSVLEGQYGKMLDPTSFINDIMKNYTMSKGATYQRDQLGRGIGATAAAGGIAGTPEHQREYGEMAHNIMSGDMQQYLQNALGVMGTGISGEQDFYNKGYGASGSLADILGGNLASQGTLAFQGATQRNTDHQALMNSLAKLLSSGAGAHFGGIEGAKVGEKMF